MKDKELNDIYYIIVPLINYNYEAIDMFESSVVQYAVKTNNYSYAIKYVSQHKKFCNFHILKFEKSSGLKMTQVVREYCENSHCVTPFNCSLIFGDEAIKYIYPFYSKESKVFISNYEQNLCLETYINDKIKYSCSDLPISFPIMSCLSENRNGIIALTKLYMSLSYVHHMISEKICFNYDKNIIRGIMLLEVRYFIRLAVYYMGFKIKGKPSELFKKMSLELMLGSLKELILEKKIRFIDKNKVNFDNIKDNHLLNYGICYSAKNLVNTSISLTNIRKLVDTENIENIENNDYNHLAEGLIDVNYLLIKYFNIYKKL